MEVVDLFEAELVVSAELRNLAAIRRACTTEEVLNKDRVEK